MSLSNIPISQLVQFESVDSDDFVALVESSSLTTYKVPLSSFLNLIAASGSVISSSYSLISNTSFSSSFSNSSSLSILSKTSSISIQSNTSSLSLYLVGSHTGSTFGTSSWSVNSTFSSQSILSNTSSFSLTSSYISGLGSYSQTSLSSSWASSSLSASVSISSSNSITSSFSISSSWSVNCATASYIIPISSVGLKAYGAFNFWAYPATVGVGAWGSPRVTAAYNLHSITYSGATLYNSSTGASFTPRSGQSYYIKFATPMPSIAYVVCVTSGGEETGESILWTVHPFTKTVNGFYIVRCGGTADNNTPYVESNWVEFAVFM